MGLLIEGRWHDQWYDTRKSKGEFLRTNSQFRNWITADGSAGPSGESGFPAEAGRYHLYVSLACPAEPSAVIQLRNCEFVRRNSPLLFRVSYH
jgi:glutathionyl-hydroquinone reductase